MESIYEFLSHISHDIRTPLNGIVGMAEMAEKCADDPVKVRECMHQIKHVSQYLELIINDVMDLNRVKNGHVHISREALDMKELLEESVRIIMELMPEKNLQFETDFSDFAHPYVYSDKLHLKQILLNILSNAVKFTSDGGHIIFRAKEISITGDKVRYRFEVEDNGIGMSEEFQKHVFEKFTQENANIRTNFQGCGLGLAISKKYAELMNGTIDVVSKQHIGSCFGVNMEFEINQNVMETERNEESEVELNGMKILLVEDNIMNLEIARFMLEDEGIEVITAENGKIAVETFEKSQSGEFDVILMDIMMPVMNGLEAAKHIRESGRDDGKIIPIIAMTANAYEEDKEQSMAVGMNEHLTKPLTSDTLYNTLAKYRN